MSDLAALLVPCEDGLTTAIDTFRWALMSDDSEWQGRAENRPSDATVAWGVWFAQYYEILGIRIVHIVFRSDRGVAILGMIEKQAGIVIIRGEGQRPIFVEGEGSQKNPSSIVEGDLFTVAELLRNWMKASLKSDDERVLH